MIPHRLLSQQQQGNLIPPKISSPTSSPLTMPPRSPPSTSEETLSPLNAPLSSPKSSQSVTNLQLANLDDIFTSRLLSEIPPALDSLLTSLLSLERLSEVNLSDNAFGLNTVEPLVKFLEKAVPLRHLILNNNGLGPHAGTMIANALTALVEKKRSNLFTKVVYNSRPRPPDIDTTTSIPAMAPKPLETLVCGRNRLEGRLHARFRIFFPCQHFSQNRQDGSERYTAGWHREALDGRPFPLLEFGSPRSTR